MGYPDDYELVEGVEVLDDPYAIAATEEILMEVESAQATRSRKQRTNKKLSVANAVHEFALRRVAELKTPADGPTKEGDIASTEGPGFNPVATEDTMASVTSALGSLTLQAAGIESEDDQDDEVIDTGVFEEADWPKEDPAAADLRLFERLGDKDLP